MIHRLPAWNRAIRASPSSSSSCRRPRLPQPGAAPGHCDDARRTGCGPVVLGCALITSIGRPPVPSPSGMTDGRGAAQVEPGPVRRADQPQQHRRAPRAARDPARVRVIHAGPGRPPTRPQPAHRRGPRSRSTANSSRSAPAIVLPSRSAVVSSCLCHPFPPQSVSHPPLGPNRSVRIRSGAWPRATKVGHVSTKPVGPHTKQAGASRPASRARPAARRDPARAAGPPRRGRPGVDVADVEPVGPLVGPAVRSARRSRLRRAHGVDQPERHPAAGLGPGPGPSPSAARCRTRPRPAAPAAARLGRQTN